jgi:ribosomal protein S18 acetylase RimI-like enzyme
MSSIPSSIVALTSESDLAACAELMMRSSPWKDLHFEYQQCLDALRSKEMSVHGLLSESKLIAFIATLATGIGFEPLIEFVCVNEDSRSRGIGSALIEFFEEILFPKAKNLYLFVSDINPRALALYERKGYSKVGALPNFNIPGQTEFLMRKTRGPRQS